MLGNLTLATSTLLLMLTLTLPFAAAAQTLVPRTDTSISTATTSSAGKLNYPTGIGYLKDHMWVRRISTSHAVVGISSFLIDQLGSNIVSIRLPTTGQILKAQQKCGEIESACCISDYFSPVSGTIVATNRHLTDKPDLLANDCYGLGWLFTVALSNEEQLETLSSMEYQIFLQDSH